MKETRVDYLFDGIALASAAISIEQVFQIILLVLGCISSAISIAYSLYKWFKRAKEDGKISKEEIKEGIDIAKNGVNDLVDKVKKGE